jgi:pimeloyl-ACP methyl ester carboxylesterase
MTLRRDDRPRYMRVNGVDLCVETFGAAGDPPILLIMGSGASMEWWEDAFCARLQAGGRFVVRYDHRDTGESVSYEPGAPPYSSSDLVADAVGVVTALELERAHLVGMSMGGAIAQLAGLDHGDRVASLTLISTSAMGPGLPGMADRLGPVFAQPRPDIDDREALLDYLIDYSRALASEAQPFDADGTRALWERALARAANVESMLGNHDLAEGGPGWHERLGEIAVPTLVIHGDDDPFMPLAHGEALADAIPGARLLVLEGTGHELPRRTWDVVVPSVLAHTT